MINRATRSVTLQMARTLRHNRDNRGVPLFTCFLDRSREREGGSEREGASRGNDTLVPGGFLSSCERVASATWKEGEGGSGRRWRRVAGGWIHLSFS